MKKFLIGLSLLFLIPGADASRPLPRYVESELLVKLESPSRLGELIDLSRQIGATDGGEVNSEFPQWRKLLFPSGTNLDDAMKFLRSVKSVLHVEPNYLYYPSVRGFDYVPSDEKFKDQWALFNFGQKVEGTVGQIGADIDILRAWNFRPGVKDAAGSVIVAVVDTGVTYDHPDLKRNIWKNAGEIGPWSSDGGPCNPKKQCCDKSCNRIDDDQDGFIDDYQGWDWTPLVTGGHPQQLNGDNDPYDDVGHGTHVSGVIGASHGDKGMAGINASVQILPLKFISANGSGELTFAVEAIVFAVKHGADVINASWGGGGDSFLLHEVIQYAVDHGVLFVAAAGNDGMDNDIMGSYPANYPEVFSVVATDSLDEIASFSNTGRARTQIAAPGVNILSCYRPFLGFNGQYSTISGTSMAAPQVSGVAAMLIGLYPSKFKHHPEAVQQRIMESSDIQDRLLPRTASGGRLNAYNAVAGIVTPGHVSAGTMSWKPGPSFSVESSHPYENGTDMIWHIEEPGAKWIRLVFGRYSIESVNDLVEVRDGNGHLIDVLTGFGMSAYSHPIQGDQVQIRFLTNGHVTGWGFEIKGYEVVL